MIIGGGVIMYGVVVRTTAETFYFISSILSLYTFTKLLSSKEDLHQLNTLALRYRFYRELMIH